MSIPISRAETYKPYCLPNTLKSILVLSDIHIPYHDNKALRIALEQAKKQKPEAIILLGDVIDMYMLSHFCKTPTKRSFPNEVKDTIEFLQHLRNNHKQAKILWVNGNHEERLFKFVQTKSPELIGLDCLSMASLFNLEKLRIEYVTKPIVYNDLLLIHGSEISGKCSPVNPARSAYQKTLNRVIVGHHHRTSTHTEVSWQGKRIESHSVGCLCELTPEYSRINKWNHGFMTIMDGKVDNVVL